MQAIEDVNINISEDYKVIELIGENVIKFLQGQLSCDVTKLENGVIITGAFCNIKGRVIAIVEVFKISNNIYCATHGSIFEEFIENLNKYAALSRISIKTCNFSCLATTNLDKKDNTAAQKYGDFYKTYINAENKHKEERNKSNMWYKNLICNGIPSINRINSEKFLPHDLNLHKLGYISFNKGCYRGQEIIARMEYKGKLKKSLCYLVTSPTENLYKELSDVFNDDNNIGKIVNTVTLTKEQHSLAIIENRYLDDINNLPHKIKLFN